MPTIDQIGWMIRDNPMLAGSIAVVVAIFAFLLLSAVITSVRGRKKKAVVRREPGFGYSPPEPAYEPAHQPAYEPAFEPTFEAAPEREPAYDPPRDSQPAKPPRRGFGFGALFLAFLVGVGAGIGGLAISPKGQVGSAIQSLAGAMEAGLSNAREAMGLDDPGDAAATAAVEDGTVRLETGDAAPAGDVNARLAVFAGNLKENLPRDAGPELALTGVDTAGMTLSLSYTVGRPLDDSEIPDFDAYIQRTVKSLFCGQEAREIRYLNDNGVAFHMTYADPGGATVADITVPPQFCA